MTDGRPSQASPCQRDAIRQAEEAGAVILRYVDTSFVPDREGGYAMNTEWEQQGTTLRMCTIPGCFRQLNISKVEPSWL